MRMDAKEYALANYAYALLKVFLGFLLCGLLFGLMQGVAVWQCLLIPFFVVGLKLTMRPLPCTITRKPEKPPTKTA